MESPIGEARKPWSLEGISCQWCQRQAQTMWKEEPCCLRHYRRRRKGWSDKDMLIPTGVKRKKPRNGRKADRREIEDFTFTRMPKGTYTCAACNTSVKWSQHYCPVHTKAIRKLNKLACGNWK